MEATVAAVSIIPFDALIAGLVTLVPSNVNEASPSNVFAVPDPVITLLFALLLIVIPAGTACQEQLPSPSSLRYLLPPLSPVDKIAVPSGVEVTVSQLGLALLPFDLRNLPLSAPNLAGAPDAP